MEKYAHVTADWARKQSDQVLGEKAKAQLAQVYEKIEKAVKSNERSISFGRLENVAT
jgi:hypothetical protein